MTTTNTQRRAPTHSLYVVSGDNENARWTRIGAAWPNQDGKGFSMALDAAPIAGRLDNHALHRLIHEEASRIGGPGELIEVVRKA